MIIGSGVQHRLAQLARAVPGAFRGDPVFRYAVLGAALALLVLVANVQHQARSVPVAPPAPATLGASYSDRGGLAASTAPNPPNALNTAGPIAPSRSLSGMTIHQDPRAPVDGFGTITATQPHRSSPNGRP